MSEFNPAAVGGEHPRPMAREPVIALGAAVAALAAAAILAALAFQHLGGYQPCALCLMQRTPYYIGIPLAVLAALAARFKTPRALVAILFGLVALLMLYNAGLAVYHSGVEWKLWPGPASCAPSVGVGNAADMLNQLSNTHAPSCTDAAWRLFGLSFAGWNVLVSAVLAAMCAAAARLAWRRT